MVAQERRLKRFAAKSIVFLRVMFVVGFVMGVFGLTSPRLMNNPDKFGCALLLFVSAANFVLFSRIDTSEVQ